VRELQQSLKTGDIRLVEIPSVSQIPKNKVLVRSICSLISPGTERMLQEFGSANWISKARQQPDKIKLVFDKILTDGLLETVDSVKTKLDKPIQPGYSNVGVVLAVGNQVKDLAVGDTVVSNGAHAEEALVSSNLCARVPDGIPSHHAAFTVLGAIAMQGLREADIKVGEKVAVIGMGLVGQLTARVAIASGCEVVAFEKNELRASVGVKQNITTYTSEAVFHSSAQAEFDVVIVAAASRTSEPLNLAMSIARTGGRIVVTGVCQIEASRDTLFKKQLSIKVSTSYGAGRYEWDYEEKGADYPKHLVRWTAKRNFQAFLLLLSSDRVRVDDLISGTYNIEDFKSAYSRALDDTAALGVLFEYGVTDGERHKTKPKALPSGEGSLAFSTERKHLLGVIGVGNYCSKRLLPILAKMDVALDGVVSISGSSAARAKAKFGFEFCSTDLDGIFKSSCSSIIIATPHYSHATLVLRGLEAGKRVFVEKPLCMSLDELEQIERAYQDAIDRQINNPLMVGFNRRYAPLSILLKQEIALQKAGISVIMEINAGKLPQDHWVSDEGISGSRIVGEVCHFFDLALFLIEAPLESITRNDVGIGESKGGYTFILRFQDGSLVCIHYLEGGANKYPKETITAYCGNNIIKIDNFKRLKTFGPSSVGSKFMLRQDKGQRNMMESFFFKNNDNGVYACSQNLFQSSKLSLIADTMTDGQTCFIG
jgi:predicted dehydrogenase/NADPH:quinone reductase-like Zn-dependent oxidoreductase